MTDRRAPDDPPAGPPADPATVAAVRRRLLWHRIGYVLSALWVGGILVATGGDVRHPLFTYIFIVPLAGWALGLVVARLIGARRQDPPRV